MNTYVFTTFRGRRFHDDRHCTALDNGRCVSGSWAAIRARLPESAARAGYTACRVCVPARFALPATGETFGHEPTDAFAGTFTAGPHCARCRYDAAWISDCDFDGPPIRSSHVPWPCMSAVVLGLAPRDGAL